VHFGVRLVFLTGYSQIRFICTYRILRMMQYGLVHYWKQKYIAKKPTCGRKLIFEGVTLSNAAVPLVILISGTIVASILFAGENVRFNDKH